MLVDKPDEIPRIPATLTFRDRLGAWKVRWGFGRSHFRVKPGLYRVGDPTPDSSVMVTANYKLSFDCLRSQLIGIDAWILVLDTRGVNVWCSAGKGTFSTDELVKRIEVTGLQDVVKHKKLILPQLSATGVAAHKVKELSGFKVKFGPVRAEDLPAYLSSGLRATPEMRRVRFPLRSRLVLIPYDLVISSKYLFLVAICFFFRSFRIEFRGILCRAGHLRRLTKRVVITLRLSRRYSYHAGAFALCPRQIFLCERSLGWICPCTRSSVMERVQ